MRTLPPKVKEQHIAVFGESGSGKTVLVSSFYGATQESSFSSENHYRVIADDIGQGTYLRQNYLRMKNAAQVPEHSRFAAVRYSFTLKPRSGPGEEQNHAFNTLRLVWHDYPGGWFEHDPSSDEEARRRIDTFRALLKSDVAVVLVDGQKLRDYRGEEEKYLKSLFWGLRSGLERLKDDILIDGERLRRFPRIWIIALSKADLHPGLGSRAFQDLVIEKAAGDVTALRDTLAEFVEFPQTMSMGEDFFLLSSAKFESDKIAVTERLGLDLVPAIAFMLPIKRLAEWIEKFDIPVRVLGGLVENSDEFATVLAAGAAVAAKLLSNIPKIGPLIGLVALPTLLAAAEMGQAKLEELHAKALQDRDYLTATLTQFRLDLERSTAQDVLTDLD